MLRRKIKQRRVTTTDKGRSYVLYGVVREDLSTTVPPEQGGPLDFRTIIMHSVHNDGTEKSPFRRVREEV